MLPILWKGDFVKKSKLEKTKRDEVKDSIDDFDLVKLNRRKKVNKNHRRRKDQD